MEALTDEQRGLLDALDFLIPCSDCGGRAAWTITARCCGLSALKCAGCYARWETIVAQRLGRQVECQGCGVDGPLRWEWYRVVHV